MVQSFRLSNLKISLDPSSGPSTSLICMNYSTAANRSTTLVFLVTVCATHRHLSCSHQRHLECLLLRLQGGVTLSTLLSDSRFRRVWGVSLTKYGRSDPAQQRLRETKIDFKQHGGLLYEGANGSERRPDSPTEGRRAAHARRAQHYTSQKRSVQKSGRDSARHLHLSRVQKRTRLPQSPSRFPMKLLLPLFSLDRYLLFAL